MQVSHPYMGSPHALVTSQGVAGNNTNFGWIANWYTHADRIKQW